MSFSRTMGSDHQHCDGLFAQAEELVGGSDWVSATPAFQAFERALDVHFRREEDVLFPALEAATGGPVGPVHVMRLEHARMRDTVGALRQAVATQDRDDALGLFETLLVLMQQHNLKEEHILYRMMDRALAADEPALQARLTALAGA